MPAHRTWSFQMKPFLFHQCDYLHIQYEVNGNVVMNDAAALHHLEFHIRSPSSAPSISSTLGPDE